MAVLTPSPATVGLAEILVGLCSQKGLRLVTAESCTAGLVASTLSRAIGADRVLLGGYVTYTKDAKARMLNVSMTLLEGNGAIDGIVAEQMAKGAMHATGADIALAVTGVTGSTPDEDGNPVGLVFTAVADKSGSRHLRHEFGPLVPPALCDLAIKAVLDLALHSVERVQSKDEPETGGGA